MYDISHNQKRNIATAVTTSATPCTMHMYQICESLNKVNLSILLDLLHTYYQESLEFASFWISLKISLSEMTPLISTKPNVLLYNGSSLHMFFMGAVVRTEGTLMWGLVWLCLD
jgi:hypothetical protein